MLEYDQKRLDEGNTPFLLDMSIWKMFRAARQRSKENTYLLV